MAGLERVPVGGVARVVVSGCGVAVHGGRGHLPGGVGVGNVGNGDLITHMQFCNDYFFTYAILRHLT